MYKESNAGGGRGGSELTSVRAEMAAVAGMERSREGEVFCCAGYGRNDDGPNGREKEDRRGLAASGKERMQARIEERGLATEGNQEPNVTLAANPATESALCRHSLSPEVLNPPVKPARCHDLPEPHLPASFLFASLALDVSLACKIAGRKKQEHEVTLLEMGRYKFCLTSKVKRNS